MRDDLSSLYAFNRWANARVLDAVGSLSAEQYAQEPEPGWASVRATLVHYADATVIWSKRLKGEPVLARATEAEVPNLQDVSKLLAHGHDAFDLLIPTLTPEKLESLWSYRDLQGKESRLPLWSVYRHVVNHATYHRGQIASKLKRFGIEPPLTDFVAWAIERTKG